MTCASSKASISPIAVPGGSVFVRRWTFLAAAGLERWAVGISLYVVALRPMSTVGVTSAEMQTAVWFAMTIIGVVVFSGRFFTWQWLDQTIAVLVVVALGWLLVRTGD